MQPGDRLEKYVLDRLLGSGGMGTVWLAHDEELDRKVALKVLRPMLADDETARARLIREARAMARLRHPNVITVYDASSANGVDFVVMELVDGQTMASWLLGDKPEPQAIIAALVAAGRGLAAAHAAGMVHRDFKPHNVLIETGGRVLVTDFGLARSLEEPVEVETDPAVTIPGGPSGRRKQPSVPPAPDPVDLRSPLTKTGHVVGTPAYMAPEQMAGLRFDERSDQFAFCVTAWEALSGSRPFEGAVTADIARAIHAQQPLAIDRVPRRLRRVLRRGLHRDPHKRWSSMNRLVAAIERAWKRPRTVVIAAAAAIVLAGGATAIAIAMQDDQPAAAPSTCGRGRDAIASAWSPEARDAMRRKFTLGADDLILTDLDAWAAQWTAAFDANCAQPSDADFAARRVCLDAQRDEAAGFFASIDAKALESLRNSELALLLPHADSCARSPRTIAPPLPTDPAKRAKVGELRHALLRLELDATPPADYETMAARARKILDEARALEYPPIEAEALEYVAYVRRALVPEDLVGQMGAWGEAYQLYATTAERADAIGYDRVRADALLGELDVSVAMANQFETLDELVKRVEQAVTRLGDPTRDLALEMIRADIAFQQNLWTQVIDRASRVRNAWKKRNGRTMVARTTLLEVEARELRHANNDLEESAAILRDTLALPILPSDRAMLERQAGRIALRRGKLEEARAAFAKSDTPYPEITTGGGAPNGGTIAGVVTGVAPGTLADTISYTRRSLPTIAVTDAQHAWAVLADETGKFELTAVPPGHYSVTVTVTSSAGDAHGIRTKADVTAGRRVDLKIDMPAPERVDNLTVDELDLIEGLVVVLGGGAVPKTGAAFRAALADAPWFTASAFDNANQAVLGPTYSVCMIVGALVGEDGRLDKDPTDVQCLRPQKPRPAGEP